ncbi:MAG: hypothetical protein CBD51_007085, partial [Flavobacteriales bacterium TMED191]
MKNLVKKYSLNFSTNTYLKWLVYTLFLISFCSVGQNTGCTDTIACNFDSAATEDDGSCDYVTECIDGCIINMIPENETPFDVTISCVNIQQAECAGTGAEVFVDWEITGNWDPTLYDFMKFKAGSFSTSDPINGSQNSGTAIISIPFPGEWNIEVEMIGGGDWEFTMPFDIQTNPPVFEEITITDNPEIIIDPLCDGARGTLKMGPNAVSGGSPASIFSTDFTWYVGTTPNPANEIDPNIEESINFFDLNDNNIYEEEEYSVTIWAVDNYFLNSDNVLDYDPGNPFNCAGSITIYFSPPEPINSEIIIKHESCPDAGDGSLEFVINDEIEGQFSFLPSVSEQYLNPWVNVTVPVLVFDETNDYTLNNTDETLFDEYADPDDTFTGHGEIDGRPFSFNNRVLKEGDFCDLQVSQPGEFAYLYTLSEPAIQDWNTVDPACHVLNGPPSGKIELS